MRKALGAVLVTCLVVGAASPVPGFAATAKVPEDYATIQEAIDALPGAANIPDVVLVSPGTYAAAFKVEGKGLHIRSKNAGDPSIVAATILKSPVTRQAGPIATFGPSERRSLLSGFTITGSNNANGAILCQTGSWARIDHCVITKNSGIGIQCELECKATIEDNAIRDNGGHGIAYWMCEGAIQRNTISLNKGSGIMCSTCGGDAWIRHNLIERNEAPTGGGILVVNSCTPQIDGNTIVANKAEVGAGIYCSLNSRPWIRNSIIALNQGGGVVVEAASEAEVHYCDVFGNEGGNYIGIADQTGTSGNISEDPLFAAVGQRRQPDYHLKSEAGRFNPAAASWVTDTVTSPCIDAAAPNLPVDEEPAPNGGRANMGRYGGTAEASKSPRAGRG